MRNHKHLFAAPVIYPVSSPPLLNHAVATGNQGEIVEIVPVQDVDGQDITWIDGALIPGFVNAHCHLELSHLKDQFPQKTGLPAFLKQVVARRQSDPEEIERAMSEADADMWNKGIVAVADICNQAVSFPTKKKSRLHYFSFIELLSFDPKKADKSFDQGVLLLQQLNELSLPGSLVPHAPYTVSSVLLEKIAAFNLEHQQPSSIHMLESNDENELFLQGTGQYIQLYRDLQLDLSFFKPTGTTSLESVLPHLPPKLNMLLVHNTISTAADMIAARESHPNLWWCFCPQANLFIEDRLPDIPSLSKVIPPDRIVLGTDSLASNHCLSIESEINTLLQAFPDITFQMILPWATLNGARFLGIDHQFGSLEPGKTPGLLQWHQNKATRLL